MLCTKVDTMKNLERWNGSSVSLWVLVFEMVPDGGSTQTEVQVSVILILFQREIKNLRELVCK